MNLRQYDMVRDSLDTVNTSVSWLIFGDGVAVTDDHDNKGIWIEWTFERYNPNLKIKRWFWGDVCLFLILCVDFLFQKSDKKNYRAQCISFSTPKVLILGLWCAYISKTFRKVLPQ